MLDYGLITRRLRENFVDNCLVTEMKSAAVPGKPGGQLIETLHVFFKYGGHKFRVKEYYTHHSLHQNSETAIEIHMYQSLMNKMDNVIRGTSEGLPLEDIHITFNNTLLLCLT